MMLTDNLHLRTERKALWWGLNGSLSFSFLSTLYLKKVSTCQRNEKEAVFQYFIDDTLHQRRCHEDGNVSWVTPSRDTLF